jgi:hypothetical protein
VKPAPRKSRIKQGVTRGVFAARAVGAPAGRGAVVPGRRMDFDEMCRPGARLGIRDLTSWLRPTGLR